MQHLLNEGILTTGHGYHKFGELFAEIIKGSGFTFHRPCKEPENPENIEVLEDLESRPKTSKELSIKKSQDIITRYLENKEVILVYQWTRQVKIRKVYCHNCGEEGHFASECDDDDDDDEFLYNDEFEND